MTAKGRLFGFDLGDWLVLVMGLAVAGSLTLVV